MNLLTKISKNVKMNGLLALSYYSTWIYYHLLPFSRSSTEPDFDSEQIAEDMAGVFLGPRPQADSAGSTWKHAVSNSTFINYYCIDLQ